MKRPALPAVRLRPDFATRWREAAKLRDDLVFVAALLRRRWLFLAIWMTAWIGAGLWIALTTPSVYEAETVLLVKEASSPIHPYSTAATTRNLENRALHKAHLVEVLRGDEVIRATLARFPVDQWPLLLALRDVPDRASAIDRMKRDLVRVRMFRESPRILVCFRAGDSALVARFATLFVSVSDSIVRERFRASTEARVLMLQAALAANTDPAAEGRLREVLAAESEHGFLMGGRAVEVITGPNVMEKRVAPMRKLTLALTASLAFSWGLLVLLVADPRGRARFFGIVPSQGLGFTPADSAGGLARGLVSIVLLFMVFYNISFKIAPSVTTARLAAIFLVTALLLRGVDPLLGFARSHLAPLLCIALVLLHAFIAYFLGARDTTQPSRLVELFYAGLLGPVLWLAFARPGWHRFHLHVMLAVLAQAILHVVSFLSEGFRQFVAAHLVQLGTYELTYAIVPPGFSNGAAASFSVVQALGVISTLITLRNARSLPMRLLCTLAVTVMLVSAGVAGRTGMLVSLLMMMVFALRSGAGLRLAVLSALGVIVAAFVVFLDEIKLLVGLLGEDLDWQLNSILKRSFEVFRTGNSHSLQELAAMYIPPLGPDTVFGTGLVRTIFGARHDSGYVQSYHALGLPMALLCYGAIFLFVLRLRAALPARPGREAWLFAWLIPLMFLLEIKEPFITNAITFYTVASMLAFASPQTTPRPGEGAA